MGYLTYTTPHGDVRLVAEDTTAQARVHRDRGHHVG